MNEIRFRPGRRSHSRPRAGRQLAAVPTPPIDWSAIVLKSLPQEPARNLGEVVWNAYKKDLWAKFGSDSLLGFELFRMAAREPGMPDGLKLLANILAGFCVFDGY